MKATSFLQHVKIQLAGVTYFVYYGPGRVIIKQDHPAYALYFILSGEVAVSQDYYDPILNEMVTESIGTLGPGEMFGEVSLLHNIPRTATVITTSKLIRSLVPRPKVIPNKNNKK